MGRRPKLENRIRILEAACGMFHQNGYNGVSMDQVAAAAKVKKANLFHYYPSKEALGLAVLDHSVQCAKERITRRFEPAGADPIRLIESMFLDSAKSMKDSRCCGGCIIGNLAQELSDQNEAMRRKIAEYLQFWSLQIAGVLKRARRGGYFKKDLKPLASAEAIVAAYEGALLFCKAKKQTACLGSAEAMVSQYLRSFRNGAVRRPPSRSSTRRTAALIVPLRWSGDGGAAAVLKFR